MTPLVLVHGFLGGSDQWDLQAPLGADRPLIKLDLPGFGRHAHLTPATSIAAWASWALDTLTAQGITRFDLLGHSMGGMVVQEMTKQAPDRVTRLILYATGAVGVLPGRFEPIETSKSRARLDGAEATARRIAATWFLNGEDAQEFPACADIAARAKLPAVLTGLDAMAGWSGVSALPDIACETLVVWGDRDRTYPWSQIATLWRDIPNTRLAVIPDCAHAVHLEEPKIFNDLLSRFLIGKVAPSA